MKTQVKTMNGLALDAIFIRNLPHIQCFLFYCQDRLMMTDYDYNEIKSLDVVQLIYNGLIVMSKADILKLSVDSSKMNAELVKWMDV